MLFVLVLNGRLVDVVLVGKDVITNCDEIAAHSRSQFATLNELVRFLFSDLQTFQE